MEQYSNEKVYQADHRFSEGIGREVFAEQSAINNRGLMLTIDRRTFPIRCIVYLIASFDLYMTFLQLDYAMLNVLCFKRVNIENAQFFFSAKNLALTSYQYSFALGMVLVSHITPKTLASTITKRVYLICSISLSHHVHSHVESLLATELHALFRTTRDQARIQKTKTFPTFFFLNLLNNLSN
jgi:hypothetical protein